VGLHKANPIVGLNHKVMDFKLQQPIELKKECECGKRVKLIGSSSSGFYTLCDCNKVGYFEDSKGNEIYYQDKSNSDES